MIDRMAEANTLIWSWQDVRGIEENSLRDAFFRCFETKRKYDFFEFEWSISWTTFGRLNWSNNWVVFAVRSKFLGSFWWFEFWAIFIFVILLKEGYKISKSNAIQNHIYEYRNNDIRKIPASYNKQKIIGLVMIVNFMYKFAINIALLFLIAV